MAAIFTKQPDGDANFGSWNAVMVGMRTAAADYVAGGYAVVGGVTASDNSTPNLINVDLWRVYGLVDFTASGYVVKFNQATQKVQVFQQSAATGPLTEVPAGTDLSAIAFVFLLLGL